MWRENITYCEVSSCIYLEGLKITKCIGGVLHGVSSNYMQASCLFPYVEPTLVKCGVM
jgi:hypothetical protein